MDREGAARAIEDFLRALGHEPEGELADTGKRVADAWFDELLSGHQLDAGAILRDGAVAATEDGDESPDGGLVVLRDLAVAVMCPHHLLPAFGRADVLYMPTTKVAGLGAIAHALRALTRRLVLQEHAGACMADLLIDELDARGAGCRLRLTHTCLVTRGARESEALTETVALRGSFQEQGDDRDLALAALTTREKLGE